MQIEDNKLEIMLSKLKRTSLDIKKQLKKRTDRKLHIKEMKRKFVEKTESKYEPL